MITRFNSDYRIRMQERTVIKLHSNKKADVCLSAGIQWFRIECVIIVLEAKEGEAAWLGQWSIEYRW